MLLMVKNGTEEHNNNLQMKTGGVLADDECADYYRKCEKIPAICESVSVWDNEVILLGLGSSHQFKSA